MRARWPLVLLALFSIGGAAHAQAPMPQARFADQDYAGVIALLADAEALSPELAYLLGRAYQEEYQHARALDAFQRADTMAVRVLRAQAASYERLGQPAPAIDAYRRALDLAPESVGLKMALARLYVDERAWADAWVLLAAATEQQSETPAIRVEFARALAAMDSLEAALVQLERAHRQAPASRSIPLLLSQVYLSLEMPYGASRVLERALAERPDDAWLWARWGAVHQQVELYDRALDAYGRALALGDSSAATWRGLGMTRYLTSDYAGALSDLERAYARDSTHARTAFYLGLSHKQLEAYAEAERWLNQAAQLTGRAPLADIFEHLADAQRFQNDYRAAIRTDEAVLFLDPGRLSTLFHLAVLYDEFYADPAPAVRQYEAFVRDAMTSGAAERTDVLVMLTYAQNRIAVLQEDAFFGRPPTVDSSDAPPDTSVVPEREAR